MATSRRRSRIPLIDTPRPTREWAEFADPDDPGRNWLVDVTFLTSGYHCIWGSGCKGILVDDAEALAQGCCSFGAHFRGEDDDGGEDLRRVEKSAARLTADMWEHFRVAARKGFVATRNGESKSRVVEGACIFLNRPGFAGGAGCALHRGAVAAGEEPMSWKPDVCWQVPLRVTHDGDVSRLTAWTRADWGDAGADFHWWCTEAPEAFGAREAVYVTLAAELRELLGSDALYDAVAAHCAARGRDRTRVRQPAER